MTLSVTFSKEELPALRKVLDRAMNTWEPQNQPPWLGELSDRVDQALAKFPHAAPSGSWPTDLEARTLRAQQRAGGLLA